MFDVGVDYQPKPGEFGITELMIAVLGNNSTEVAALLAAGADVNAADYSGTTALIGAAAYGHLQIVQQLISAGADTDRATDRGETALGEAVRGKYAAIAQALLEAGANPDTYLNANRPEFRTSVLEYAAVAGQKEVVESLIARGVNLKADGPSALMNAVWKGHTRISAALIVAGVDVNVPAKKTRNLPLHGAARSGNTQTVELLLQHGATVEVFDDNEQTPLHHAVRGGHSDVVDALLSAGALVSFEDLSAALGTRNSDIAGVLIDRLDTLSLSSSEIDSLVMAADRAAENDIIAALFAAAEARQPKPHRPRFLFARSDNEEPDCKVTLWDPSKNTEAVVFLSEGDCEAQFFVDEDAQTLFVLSNDAIQIVSLDGEPDVGTVAMPTEQIEQNARALDLRLQAGYGGTYENWATANPVAIGYLSSGELALVMHTGGPADETYGYLYARYGNGWHLLEDQVCHRFDSYCRFGRVEGRQLMIQPVERSVWHPNTRLNPFFVRKNAESADHAERPTGRGSVDFNIAGRVSTIHYTVEESGHCAGDCVYTSRLVLQLPDGKEVSLSDWSGQHSIVDRYVLAYRNRHGPELFDIATGESVFGSLQFGTWIN